MKTKIILLAALLFTLRATALDWTYSTNLFWELSYPTNIFLGTNSSDGATNGDTFYQWGTKINAAMNLFQRRYQAQAATNAWLTTNPVSGGTNTVSINSPASSTATTYGFGAGVVCVDTNYIYVSVASNSWKRVILDTNGW